LEIEPNFIPALVNLPIVLAEKGMYDEALAIIRKMYAFDAELTKALEDGLEKVGYKGAARAVADLQAEWYGKPGKNVSALNIANLYHAAGEYDLAIDWLEKAYEEHDLSLLYIGGSYSDPLPLRSNPRFQDLLRKMNLPVDADE
jgi:tetratricopeptide (TPR) repeat protein